MGDTAQLHFSGREIDWHLIHFPILMNSLIHSLGPDMHLLLGSKNVNKRSLFTLHSFQAGDGLPLNP